MARYDKDISNNKLHGKENPSVATAKGLSVEITPAIADFENGTGVGEIIKLGGIGYHATPGATLPGACYWLYQSGHTTAGNDYPNAPTWWQTDSDDPNFGGNDIVAIAMGTVPVNDGMLIRGIARIPDAYVNGTPVLGKEIFISESDHKIDFTAPSIDSEFVRVIGYCLDKNGDGDVLIHFDPDRTWLGHSALSGIDDQTDANDDQLTIKDTEVVINEDSDDLDFRVETNATATALVVDGGGDLVKIDAAQALHLKDLGGAANTPASGYGVMYVNGDTPYFKTDGGTATSMIGGGAANVPQTGSSLWYPPAAANANDDEFNSTTLDSDWLIYNFTDDTAGTVSTDDIDFYGTFNSGDAVRVTAHPATRPSWALVQIPARSKYYTMTKAYTFPTNVLVWMRAKFTQKVSIANNDGTIGIMFSATTSEHDDPQNGLFLYFNEPDSSIIRTSPWKREGGTWAQVGATTTNVTAQGQALEYAAIHKVGSDYHLWVGTESNWIYLGSTTLSFTPTRVGFAFQTVGTAPSLTHGIDFIRFVETNKFLL